MAKSSGWKRENCNTCATKGSLLKPQAFVITNGAIVLSCLAFFYWKICPCLLSGLVDWREHWGVAPARTFSWDILVAGWTCVDHDIIGCLEFWGSSQSTCRELNDSDSNPDASWRSIPDKRSQAGDIKCVRRVRRQGNGRFFGCAQSHFLRYPQPCLTVTDSITILPKLL